MKFSFQIRLYLITFIMIIGFIILVTKLWKIQVTDNNKWINKMYSKSNINVRIPGVRGEIKDRNGLTLATNDASYEVVIHLDQVINNYKEIYGSLPTIPRSRRTKKNKDREIDIVLIVNELITDRLIEIGLADFFNSNLLKIHYKTHGGLVPFIYKRNLSFIEYARFAEHSLELPGLHVRVTPSRKYIYGSLASHIIGYISPFEDQRIDKSELEKYDHYIGDDYGKAGIEKTFNKLLTAKPGKRIVEKDEKGAIGSEKELIKPEKGADIYLTIDARIQYITEKALNSIGQGAAVVINPQNGDILAMASKPSYNPNDFIPNISKEDWNKIIRDKTKPLINRALHTYAPGSTFKIATSLAASYIYSNLNKNNPQICKGYTNFGNVKMKCWIKTMYGKTHGKIYLIDAIKKSCNCYFYQISSDIGISTMKKVFTWVGLGNSTGIPLEGEKPGRVPDKIWFSINNPREKWSSARTAQVSIGQGAAEASPLQMALLSATIANEGNYYPPKLIHKIVSNDNQHKKIIEKYQKQNTSKNLTIQGINQESISTIKTGMFKVVNESGGTATRANLKDRQIYLSGKTGTAQTGGKLSDGSNDTNAWFISFAPFENPTLAAAVFVKHGKSGGRVAAPITKEIIKYSLEILDNKKLTKPLQINYVDKTQGHDEYIEEISFDDELRPTVKLLTNQAPSSNSYTELSTGRSSSKRKKTKYKAARYNRKSRTYKARKVPNVRKRRRRSFFDLFR